MSNTDPSYTIFIRLPFPRGNFVDPPAVEWDASKDKTLWKILSKASKNSDINWNELASRFEVSLPFLLQQAAWLYERQLLQVRAQMRKVGVAKSGASVSSPVPGSESAGGGEMMRRTTSGGGAVSRPTSVLAARKDSPVPGKEGSVISGRPTAPPISRTSSTNTTITSRHFNQQTSPRPAHTTLARRSVSPKLTARGQTATPIPSTQTHPTRSPRPAPLSSPSDSASSSSESERNPNYPAQSRILRRPRFTNKSSAAGRSEDGGDEDDEDEEPAFLPFAATTPTEASTPQDPSATLRGDLRTTLSARRGIPTHGSKKSNEGSKVTQSQTSDSSASTSSATPITSAAGKGKRTELGLQRERERRGLGGTPGPLSPKRTAELVGRKDSSDPGTPSMGSSFSDLDDASVTQSALEEALASNMQAGGGMASRMSTISHAFKSRYL